MRNRKVLMGVILLAAAGAAVFGYWALRPDAGQQGALRVSGNIEATDIDLSFKIPGRMITRNVEEGAFVKAGQMVALLDPTELTQEVSLRRAELQAAEAALRELQAGSRPEEVREAEAGAAKAEARLNELLAGPRAQDVNAQRAVLQSSQAEVERLTAEYTRQKLLFEKDVISAREFEEIQSALKGAVARETEIQERLDLLMEGTRPEQIEQARQSLKQTKERLALILKGPRPETIDQARARVEQAQQAMAVSETRLGYARIASPLEGIVLSQNLEAGMYAAPGIPVVTIGDLANVWLRAYISETDLGRVKTGQPVRVTADTYPGRHYEGRVSFIASQAEFTPKSVQTEKERVKLVYRIKVDIHNPNFELKPGMPADAQILLGPTSLEQTQGGTSKTSQPPTPFTLFRKALPGGRP